MNRKQALQILGLSEDDDAVFIRTRYRKLMKKYHPDASEDESAGLAMAQNLTEAYRILKEEGLLASEKNAVDWGLRENPDAFTKRMIYMEDDLFGNAITAETGLRGRFFWDPEIESFAALLKSVNMECIRILEMDPDEERQKGRAKLLHLLLQEFIDPLESLSILSSMGRVKNKGDTYTIPCQVKPFPGKEKTAFSGGKLSVTAEGSRLLAAASGESCGTIHFQENEFYYIVTPLIIQKAAKASLMLDEKRTHLSCRMEITVDKNRTTDATEKINAEIKRMLGNGSRN